MKLPNGYGTVYKLSGARRKPWIARKTTAWELIDGKKKQIVKTIGYYATRTDALQALADFNTNPYDLDASHTTLAQIYALWSEDAYSSGSTSKINNYKSAYKRCEPLYNRKMSELRTPVLQQFLDSIPDPTYDKLTRVKKLLNQLFKYCIKNEILRDNCAERLDVKIRYDRDEKQPFTTEEIQFLWKNIAQNEYIKLVLILIYSGVRINELLNLEKKDVQLDKQIFYVRKSKTDSGVRTVPIADKVLPFWREFIKKSPCDYAFTTANGVQFTYTNFNKKYWHPLMDKLGLQHNIHETRHTCITQLMQNGADAVIVKHIVGHKSVMNLTERVYTHIEPRKLIETINMIP